MWYFLWILGLGLAIWLSIVGALRLEAAGDGKKKP
jgi:cyd operon protein YbgT